MGRFDGKRLRRVGVENDVNVLGLDPTDFDHVARLIADEGPDEIYALAGQSSVGRSFDDPRAAIEGSVLGILNFLEVLRQHRSSARLCHASSGDCFGDQIGVPADETSAFRPRSPYAAAKASAHFLVKVYREAYGLFVANAVLFNHESPLRPETFVTRKIVAAAARIAAGSDEVLLLGRLDIVRDWGWAPEYAEGMWKMLQQTDAEDLILATGRSNSLLDFVSLTFAFFGLDWRTHVRQDASLIRPTEVQWATADPGRAAVVLDWRATIHLPELVERLCRDECERLSG